MPDIFGLCHKVQYAMLYVLDNVGNTVRAVEIYVALFFADECFVA